MTNRSADAISATGAAGSEGGAEAWLDMGIDADLICPLVELSLSPLLTPWQTVEVMDLFLEPGVLVRHPAQPDWGLGQVQSVVGSFVTVNFEDAGKKTINAEHVHLTYVSQNPRDRL